MDERETGTSERPYRVCLFGASFDTGNRGVSALAASLIGLILDERPDAEIKLLVNTRVNRSYELTMPGRTIRVEIVNCRLSPRALLREHLVWIFFMASLWRLIPFGPIRRWIQGTNPYLNALAQADFVGDIWGGDSFSDIYGKRLFLLGALQRIVVLFLKKDLVLLPQTYGPYRSYLARWLARYIMRRSACIFSRDKQGLATANALLGRHTERVPVLFCPDVAFTMDSAMPEATAVAPPVPEGPPLVGLNVSGLMYAGGYTRDNMFGLQLDYPVFVRDLVETFLRETDCHILLVPHTYAPSDNPESDPEACVQLTRTVPDRWRDRVHLVKGEYDQFELKGIISRCDFFIGSRMHACIAAMSQGIPTVGVSYSDKFKGVFEAVDMVDMVVDARTIHGETAQWRLLQLFRECSRRRPAIRETVAAVRGTVRESLRALIAQEPEREVLAR